VKCTFIVSAFDRPDALACLLYSLKIQTERDFQVIVSDNGGSPEMFNAVKKLEDSRFRYIDMLFSNCYQSSNGVVRFASGEYLCFPSDDNYYVPQFLELMLKPQADLIYCDMLYDPRLTGSYAPVNVGPGRDIDKGGFLVRRDCFQPFPWEREDGLRMADHFLINDLVKAGLSCAKVPGVLWVHN
jgi:glycosyltransferase involved in cell wall biosynthesis